MTASIHQQPFGDSQFFGGAADAPEVDLITLTSDQGLRVRVLTLGATLQSIRLSCGTEVLLGLASLEAYRAQDVYLGATVGRFANRIRDGRYGADGAKTRLVTKDGGHCLHGGRVGFDRAVWRVVSHGLTDEGAPRLVLGHHSPDGDQGFPGALDVTATFTLSGDRLDMAYRATTTKRTPISLTSHGYFNLEGAGAGDVEGHTLTLAADHYLPVGPDLIPEGPPAPVDGTAFDFRTPRRLAQDYDHCFALQTPRDLTRPVAELVAPLSGRRMRVYTTAPGLQLFTGHVLDGSLIGPDGRAFGRRGGLCLETQAFPDTPNRPDFPSCWLAPGETYESETRLEFA